MALSKSASDPGLRKAGSGNLAAAGAASLASASSAANLTTTNYLLMKSKALFRDTFSNVPPAGKSITVPLADSAARDLASEEYFPLPATPANQRKYRMLSHGPGEVHVHHGLHDQKLPGEDFRYGIRGIKGQTTEGTLKAGLLLGVADYKNTCAETVYESRKKEPLGKSWDRGHKIKMDPMGYGLSSGTPQDGKAVIFPVSMKSDTEEVRLQYKRTHNSYNPGERIERDYTWPEEAKEKTFRFGKADAGGQAIEGAGAKSVLNWDVNDDGDYKKTKLVQKSLEDYRSVQHPRLFEKVHCKQGATGPPCGPDKRFGIGSAISDYTAASCIKGYYSFEEQLPDQDLGRCCKVGRRNVTSETRAFGTPSVRTDIPAPPPGKRSCADNMSYGDDCSAA
ncbi:unnamed protein product, partial [Polarella glacialis]